MGVIYQTGQGRSSCISLEGFSLYPTPSCVPSSRNKPLNAVEKLWLGNTSLEQELSEVFSEFEQSQTDLKQENEKLKGDIETMKRNEKFNGIMDSHSNSVKEGLEKLMEMVRQMQMQELRSELTTLRTENSELKDKLERMTEELKNTQSKLINFEQTKDSKPEGNNVLLEQMNEQREENATLKAKFDEFEEYSEMIKKIQLDQENIEQEIKGMEERSGQVSGTLEVKIGELQSQIDNFVTETKSDLNEKKNQLIQLMKKSIYQLQGNQKALIDRCRDLEQQNVKRSETLQNKLELTAHNFNDTVQMKASLLSYYDVSPFYFY